MTEYGTKHRKDLAAHVDDESEPEESGFEQWVKLGLWSVAMFLFACTLVFALNRLEEYGRHNARPTNQTGRIQ